MTDLQKLIEKAHILCKIQGHILSDLYEKKFQWTAKCSVCKSEVIVGVGPSPPHTMSSWILGTAVHEKCIKEGING